MEADIVEGDFITSPPQAERPRGRRYLPTNPTACGCEEVDAAVPLAARRVPRLVYADAPPPSWHDATSAGRRTPFTPSGNC